MLWPEVDTCLMHGILGWSSALVKIWVQRGIHCASHIPTYRIFNWEIKNIAVCYRGQDCKVRQWVTLIIFSQVQAKMVRNGKLQLSRKCMGEKSIKAKVLRGVATDHRSGATGPKAGWVASGEAMVQCVHMETGSPKSCTTSSPSLL